MHPSRLIHRARALIASRGARMRRNGSDRGDVPGWVLVTVMTAGLVTALWAVADDQLAELFTRAVQAVSGP